MFIFVYVLKLFKENGEYFLFFCLFKDEKIFFNGILNIKYEKKIIKIEMLYVCVLFFILRGLLDF